MANLDPRITEFNYDDTDMISSWVFFGTKYKQNKIGKCGNGQLLDRPEPSKRVPKHPMKVVILHLRDIW